MPAPLFTVFTATFNRAAALHRAWESLKAQTFREFEWLVVDDGSTDNTRELVEGYAREADFPVRYFWQTNQHKKAAYNHASREARGELLVPLDSDDGCVPNALERLRWHWLNIDAAQRAGFSAVTVLCMDERGELAGDRFPGGEWCDSTGVEMAHRYRVKGEMWGFQRVDVLRRFPFPEDVQGLVPEGYVWCQIDAEYRTRFVNEALRIYYRDQGDSVISVSYADPARTADGATLSYAMELRTSVRWFAYDPLGLCKVAANLVRLALHCSLPRARVWAEVWTRQPLAARALLLAAAPVGIAIRARDAWRKRSK